MKICLAAACSLMVLLLLGARPALKNPSMRSATGSSDHPTLAIGSPAPDFSLPGVDGKTYSLGNFRQAEVLVVVFTCNHCPTAQAYEDRLIGLTRDYANRKVAVVAIMPNDPSSLSLDELGYTEMGDSFAEMKKRAGEKKFNFPYLYDGDSEKTAIAYGPVATPHVFIFDKTRMLRYSGRIDDMEKPTKTPTSSDARDAIDALLAGQPVKKATTKVFGCSVKWIEKSDWIVKAKERWAKEPVTLDSIGVTGLKELLENHSDKLRLVNVWATWCGPCVAEFPDLVDINRMYRKRDFEFITISADDPGKRDKALQFLQKSQASATNYLFNSDSKYQLIEAVDSAWPGALPYTLLVEPGGKVVYRHEGAIDADELKKAIVDNRFIGRFY